MHAHTHPHTHSGTRPNVHCPVISSLHQNKLLLWSLFIELSRVFVPKPASDQARILLALGSLVGFSRLLSIHLPVKSQGSPTVRHTMVVEEKEELGARERQQQTPPSFFLFSFSFFFNQAYPMCACCAFGLPHCLLERHRVLLGSEIVLPLRQQGRGSLKKVFTHTGVASSV